MVKRPPCQCSQSGWAAEPSVSLFRRIGSSWLRRKPKHWSKTRNGSRDNTALVLTSGSPCASALCLSEFPDPFVGFSARPFPGKKSSGRLEVLDRKSAGGVATLDDVRAWLQVSKAGPHLIGWDPGRLPQYRVGAGFTPRGVAGRPGQGWAGRGGRRK